MIKRNELDFLSEISPQVIGLLKAKLVNTVAPTFAQYLYLL